MEKQANRSVFVRSTFLWIVGLFLSANFLWGSFRPLQSVPHTSQPNLELSKAALRFKMDELKAGKTPDIMIIGSSLPMCAFFYTESPPFFDLKEGKKIGALGLNLLQSYPEAGYFSKKLKQLTGKDFDVFNFAGAACMVSDTRLVLQRSLEAHKKPRIIVYGVGLRDFVDNVNPPPGETPYYKALCNMPFLLRNIAQVRSFNSFTDLMLCAICKMYDLRNEFRLTAEHAACTTFHHPSSLEIAFMLGDLNGRLKSKNRASDQTAISGEPASAVASSPTGAVNHQPVDNNKSVSKGETSRANKSATEQAVPARERTAGTAGGAVSTLSPLDYPQRYAPANYTQLFAEMDELKSLIGACKEQGIRLVIVNMPVSQGHRRLSPPGLREVYLRELRKTAGACELFIDCESETLPDSDFFDTVHLNGVGSVKFVDELSRRLQASHVLYEPGSFEASLMTGTL